MPKTMLHLCIIVSSRPAAREVSWLSNSLASLMAAIKISQIVPLHVLYISFKGKKKKKKESLLHVFLSITGLLKLLMKVSKMKRWKVSLFRGRPRRRSIYCRAITTSEYVKFVMHKKMMLIFLCNTKMKFYLFLTRGYIIVVM